MMLCSLLKITYCKCGKAATFKTNNVANISEPIQEEVLIFKMKFTDPSSVELYLFWCLKVSRCQGDVNGAPFGFTHRRAQLCSPIPSLSECNYVSLCLHESLSLLTDQTPPVPAGDPISPGTNGASGVGERLCRK